MKTLFNSSLICRPDTASEISKLSERLLNKADVIGSLPTPIDELIEVSKIVEINSTDELGKGFFSRLKNSAQETFKHAMQKVRGIADLRERIIYIPNSDNLTRSVFPKVHELGHQIIPWHNIDPAYLDDDVTLSPEVEDMFEKEANYFASEIIFQGKLFRTHVRDYTASLHAVFKLSDIHGASVQSTIWRYVEEQDEPVAVAQYYSVDSHDDEGNHYLKLWKIVPSVKFQAKYGDIELPRYINTGHPWVSARDLKCHDGVNIPQGNDKLGCRSHTYNFEWQTWWNSYTLFVLLRRKPALGAIGNILGAKR